MHLVIYYLYYHLLFIIYYCGFWKKTECRYIQRVINKYMPLRYPNHTSSQTGNTPHADHWAFHQLGSTPAAKSARSSWQHIPWSSHLAWLVSSQITLAPYRNVPCVSLVTHSNHMTRVTWYYHHVKLSSGTQFRHASPLITRTATGSHSTSSSAWSFLLRTDWLYLS